MLKEIKFKNGDQFIKDLKISQKVMVYCQTSKIFIRTQKNNLRKQADESKIHYYMTDTLFVKKQTVMVVI